jgi:hypothetical protein
MDAKVKQLEEELQRFNEQKWGLEQQGEQQQPKPVDDARQKEWEQRAFAYNQDFAKFVAEHGKEKVAAIDAAIAALSPQQKAHVVALATEGGEGAVERVHAYVQQLGALDEGFKPKSIQDVLSGKKDEPKPEAPPQTPGLDARERAIHEAATRAHYHSSRTEFVSEFGRSNFERARAAWDQLMQSHPEAAQIEKTAYSYDNPLIAAAQIMNRLGLWSPEQAAPPRQQQAMPSNFANARSVTSRSGPAYSGPTPLNDIFKR